MKSIRKLQALIVFLSVSIVCQSQNDYTIDGTIPGVNSGKIYFSVFTVGGKRDSTTINNGVFQFKGTLGEPSPVILSLERNFVNKPLFMLFLDKGQHIVVLNKDDLRNGQAKGSTATADYEALKAAEKPFDLQFTEARKLLADTSKAAKDEYEKQRSSISENKKAATLAFIKSHPASPVTAWIAGRTFYYGPEDMAVLDEVYQKLPASLHNISYVASMKETIDKAKMLAVGKIAPNFTQNDTVGNPVSLTDFRGKYVLVDFWASWCVPCRQDNPNVVKAFHRFKDKGFTIVSVSLDQPGKKENWMKAIHQDGLTWTHVSDLKYWNNEVSVAWGVRAIPYNLLLDPKGKILAVNLHGDQLEKKLGDLIQ